MRILTFISLLFVMTMSFGSFAGVKVAFFEKRTKDGRLLPIEPGGHLYHVAIQMNQTWLEAHPFYGVREVADVHQIGDVYSIIETDLEIPLEKYKAQFGKTFSVVDPWENSNTTYCSKLVAEILDIKPVRMKSSLGVGISPDRLYATVKQLPHIERYSCQKIF